MAEEEKKPLTDQETGAKIRPTPEYTPGEAERLPKPETAADEVVTEALKASEAAAAESPVVKGFDAAISAVQEAVDKIPGPPHSRTEAYAEVHHSDTVVIMGREITVPGGIYTVVFIALGVATLLEVALAELSRGFLTIPIMLSLAVVKAVLVVAYYMHLRTDSRIFLIALSLPVAVTLAATLYLLAVPVTGY
jgi:caa(3)-type oxidase subunit IV